jgi:hypothetical protein
MIGIIFQPKYYLYLSSWNLVAVILHKYTYKHYNLLLSCIIVSIVSFCIAYISPRRLQVETHDPKETFVVDGWLMRIGDLIVHHLPLLFVWLQYSSYYLTNEHRYDISCIATLFSITMYIIVVNPSLLYGMSPMLMISSFVVAICVYLLLPGV